MTPVEEMAVAEAVEAGITQSGAGVEQAVGDVDGPDCQRQQSGDPQGKAFSRDPGKGDRPDQGDGRCVETGEVPESEGGRRFEDV